MRARYHIRTERGYVEEVFEGRVTLEPLLAFMASLYDDPAWDPALDGLADFTAAEIALSFDEMWNLVGMMRASGSASSGRWAFVVPSALNLGMTRMYEALAQDLQSQVRVFLDRADAEAWLASLQRGVALAPDA